jgi:cell filamentation protein, protein adenylyltransferase
MHRETGTYRRTDAGGEEVRAFIPHPLPPASPPLDLDDHQRSLLAEAMGSLGRLAVAGTMVPSPDWFLYGFVRKEAVISSQIEGTQATLRDVLAFEATEKAENPKEVAEVCNYVEALSYARRQISRAKGLQLSTRLLCEAHKRLMKGGRGDERQPGEIRRSQNWIGGTRPGNALFVPPPPEVVPDAMAALDRWVHADDPLPPLVRSGLAHVQFETIHPFLDGNGRIGRLLITLLVEHWNLLPLPLLYLSLAFKRRRQKYYDVLSSVRTDGDWEGWTAFYLECVHEAADDGVSVAKALFRVLGKDRDKLFARRGVTVPTLRLFEQLPLHPIVTLPRVIELIATTKPTASKAITTLVDAGILRETTGRERDRVYAYDGYLSVLTRDTH